jgi:hypothetical protein
MYAAAGIAVLGLILAVFLAPLVPRAPSSGGTGERPPEQPATPVANPQPPAEGPEAPPGTGPATRSSGGTLRIGAEADAYVCGRRRGNHGKAVYIRVRADGTVSFIRFDVSALRGPVRKAVLRLRHRHGFQGGQEGAVVGLAPVENQDWGERGVRGENEPPAGEVVARWTATEEDPPHLDVTGPVNAALAAGRAKVSFRLTVEKPGADPERSLDFHSREVQDETKRPVLEVTP